SICNDNPFCIGYTYDNANATCTTKKLKYVDNSIAGVAQFKDGNRYGMKKYYDRAFTDTSNTIHKEDTGLSVCEKICYDDPNCAGYTFKLGKTCSIHPFIADASKTSGIKTV